MRKIRYVLLAAGLLLFAACAGPENEAGTTPTDAPTATVEPTEVPATPTNIPQETLTPTPTPETDWIAAMLEDSLVSTGNNARLKKVIEKARNGEPVYIATIGGSVTEGAGASGGYGNGYAYLFKKAFEKAYGTGNNIHFVNAGLSGTPSSLGVLRYQSHVLDKLGAEPDLLIIEFAVNDYGEVTNRRAYESLIHQTLSQENDAAVVLLFAVFKTKWNMQDSYIPIGDHYELPMVSIKDAIVQPFQDGNLTDTKFFADEYHPTSYGHQIMADCLMHLFETVDAEETDERNAVPEKSKNSLDFEHVTMLAKDQEDVVLSVGSFSAIDTAVQGIGLKYEKSFPDNWMHDKTVGNESFTLTLTCKNMLLNYKTASSKTFGEAEIYVDGKLVMTLNGYSSGGWNNCNTVLIIDEKEATEHTIEIRMKEGQEDREFTILSIGYTE